MHNETERYGDTTHGLLLRYFTQSRPIIVYYLQSSKIRKFIFAMLLIRKLGSSLLALIKTRA